MARRSAFSSQGFRTDSQLRQYFLDGVLSTGKTLGVGSYGSVVEVKYRQVSCAAKRMHELLLDPGNAGVQETIEKYRRECQLMAGLRHPNITQFLGLCFLEGSELPLLVMEKLEMSVDDLLECAPSIPLPVKISILTDTCSGLVYLHGMPSPIVHRDLTARNVLLTSSLSAKITDMGNSRIVNLRSAQLAQTMSKVPGTLVYMPPEALSDSHRYGPSLDVFSFGHLALYILTQVFPGDLLSATDVDPNNPADIIGRNEVKRREVYMKELESQLIKSYPVLVEMVTNCLHNNPKMRPSAEQLLLRLQPVKKEMDLTYGGALVNVTHVLHMKEIKEKDKRIRELEKLESDMAQLSATNTRLETDRRDLEAANTRITEERNQLETNVNQLQGENNQQKTEISQLKTSNCQLESQSSQLKTEIQELRTRYELEKLELVSQHREEIVQLRNELQRSSTELGKLKTPEKSKPPPTFPQQLYWRRGPDMPVAMSGYIQSVEINGIVYVGGGWADSHKDQCIVMVYDTESCQWNSLLPYSARGFAMTSINSKLVLVGGSARDGSDSSELGEWQPGSNQWTRPFPPMPTPHCTPSATTYKHWLVVAGGYHRYRLHSIVEVLDVSNLQWSTGPSTPIPWHSMKSTTLGDTWYLMGGVYGDGGGGGCGPDVYSVSLEALVSQSASDSSTLWKKLPSLNCTLSCPLIIGETLLAVGGYDIKSKKPVSTIQRYVPETNSWVQAGLLPLAAHGCTSIMTSDKVHVIGGQDGNTGVKKMFTFNTL